MKWNKRGKYLAYSECGAYTCAAFRVGDTVAYRASRAGKWITPHLPSINEINAYIIKRGNSAP